MKKLYSYFKPIVIPTVFILSGLVSFSQSPPPPDYTFNGNTLISGVDRTVGARYRFTAVKTGFDALVTITSMVNATLSAIDATGSGWNAAFQPTIVVNRLTTGYVEFRIDFVLAGTSTIASQPQVAVTALDVDGYNNAPNQRLYEFEQFDMGANAYAEFNMGGGHINVSFTGTTVRGTNTGGLDFGSISLDERVRFTAFKSTVSSVIVRSGAINNDQFNDVSRQRSFYFARFTYSNSATLLNASDLKLFNAGNVEKNQVPLKWELAKNHNIEAIEIERSTVAGSFERINRIVNPKEGVTNYLDNNPEVGQNHYRIKLYETGGKNYYSQILTVNINSNEQSRMRIFPTVSNTKTTVYLTGYTKGSGNLLVKDYTGKIYIRKQMMINEGTSLFDVELNSSLPNGFYIISFETALTKNTFKFLKVSK